MYQPITPPPSPTRIRPGVFQLRLPLQDNPSGYVNVYLLECEGGWALVDTGWNDRQSLLSLAEQMAAVGARLEEVRLILVTHIHPDHFGLAGRLKAISGARLLLHEVEKATVDSRDQWSGDVVAEMRRWLLVNGVPPEEMGHMEDLPSGTMDFGEWAMPDAGLSHGDRVALDGLALEVIWTPGHSPGHMCLYEPQARLLFSGDHVLPLSLRHI